jgi:hypothetical protein
MTSERREIVPMYIEVARTYSRIEQQKHGFQIGNYLAIDSKGKFILYDGYDKHQLMGICTAIFNPDEFELQIQNELKYMSMRRLKSWEFADDGEVQFLSKSEK